MTLQETQIEDSNLVKGSELAVTSSRTTSNEVSTLLDSLALRYDNLAAGYAHKEARDVREDLLIETIPPRTTKPILSQLPPEARRLLNCLDMTSPKRSLAWSIHISDLAIERMVQSGLSPMRVAGAVSACVSRELWELPNVKGTGFGVNLTLSKLLGVYFTPTNVAWYIALQALGKPLAEAIVSRDLKRIVDASRMKVLDPACGTGIFLVAAYEIFAWFYRTLHHVLPPTVDILGSESEFLRRVATKQLFGIDLSRRLVNVTRHQLAAIARVPLREIAGIYQGNSLMDLGSRNPVLSRARIKDLGGKFWNKTRIGKDVDVILLNPPFGRLKFLESDYKEKSRALRASEGALRTVRDRRRRDLVELSMYFRHTQQYQHAVGGTLDWQRLFIARSLNWLGSGGRLGAIVPTSVLNDRSATRLREYIFQKTALERIDLLTESAKLFPSVNQPTCIITTALGSEKTPSFSITGPNRTLPKAGGSGTLVSASVLSKISSDTYPVPNTDRTGWSVLTQLHEAPRLGDQECVVNRRGELDVSLYRRYLGVGRTRLIRGDQVERYRLRNPIGASERNVIHKTAFMADIRRSSKHAHINGWRVVGRQCAFLEKQRRMSFVFVGPGVIVANSCNYVTWKDQKWSLGPWLLLGFLNSLVAEWRIRLTSSNNHINNYEIDDLPFPVCNFYAIARGAKSLTKLYRTFQPGTHASSRRIREAEDRLDASVMKGFRLGPEHVEKITSDICPERQEAILSFFDKEEQQ